MPESLRFLSKKDLALALGLSILGFECLLCGGSAAVAPYVVSELADCDSNILPGGNDSDELTLFDGNGRLTNDPSQAVFVGNGRYEESGLLRRYCRHGVDKGVTTEHNVEFGLGDEIRAYWDEKHGVSGSVPGLTAGFWDKGFSVYHRIGHVSIDQNGVEVGSNP